MSKLARDFHAQTRESMETEPPSVLLYFVHKIDFFHKIFLLTKQDKGSSESQTYPICFRVPSLIDKPISNPNIGSGLSILVVGLSVFNQPTFMSELDIQIPTTFDPFAEANAEDSGAGSKEYVHIRIQQRNGRKSLTTVQGLKKEFSYNKILKDLKKEFCCNGTVVQDPELGQVIQLQGDQRKNVSTFLTQAGIVKKEHIKIHGF
ncbi:Eukaryotic translation initiation factor SUI [Parasponia andersonii]|uniref:Eukaryotic translation initiation factor SUI n=1 Tax=Parasponia andersonii TaxID=3476 RepID=A0A2P5CK73_PARAD|nr:Eukaryotic translation initiation factor SUI [Parasponia andersonii]